MSALDPLPDNVQQVINNLTKRIEDLEAEKNNIIFNGIMNCKCKPEYSIVTHGDHYALMWDCCNHKHGYNLGNIQEPDFKMLEAMLSDLNGHPTKIHRHLKDEETN